MAEDSRQPDEINRGQEIEENDPAMTDAVRPDTGRSGSESHTESSGRSVSQTGELEGDNTGNLLPTSSTSQQAADSEVLPLSTRRPKSSATLSRVTLGSALIALDSVSDRLEQAREFDRDILPPPRSVEDVLIPVSEWEEQFGISPESAARHLALGMMIDARSKAGRATRLVRSVSDLLYNGVDLLLGPLARSSAISPVRRRFDLSVERGNSQVKKWKALGQAEDARSRVVAQAAVGTIADEAMDDIVESERIQLFIQEIVSAQSMGIIDEAIEEVRERTLSTDIFLERPFRRLLHRPRRDEVPPPNFDPEIIRPARRGYRPLREPSLLGYYAGFMTRLFAFALDIVLLASFMAISSWLLSTTIGLLGLDGAFGSLREATTPAGASGTIFVSVYSVIVVFGYFILFWALTGQTLGMMILGLRVVARDGQPLTLLQALLRIIGFVISISLFFLGFFWILIDDRRDGWPDKIARTHVIYAWDANPDESFLFDYVNRDY